MGGISCPEANNSVTVKGMKDSKNVDLALPHFSGEPYPVSAPDRGPEYPTLHLEFAGEDAVEFPKDGTVTFKYHLASETESDRDGKKRCSYTLEVRKLTDLKGEKDIRPSKRDTSTEENLDKLMKEKEESY